MRMAVSLLPLEYRRELEKSEKLVKVRKALLIVLIVFLAATLLAGTFRVAGNLSIQRLREQNEQAQVTINALAEYEQLDLEMQRLAGKVQGVQALDQRWFDVISSLTKALPKGVWCNNITTDVATEESAQTCTMECGAVNYKGASKSIKALRDNKSVTDVTCGAVNDSGTDVTFTLVVTLAAPAAR
ncbi:MAG: hypothetical protein RSF90_04940 [Pygmaiobacter sp.]